MPNTGALARCLKSSSAAREVVVVNAMLMASGFARAAATSFSTLSTGLAAAVTMVSGRMPIRATASKSARGSKPRLGNRKGAAAWVPLVPISSV